MKAAVISLGSVSSIWIAEELRKVFDTVDELAIDHIEVALGTKPAILHKGEPLQTYDCVYARGSYRYAILLSSIVTLLQPTAVMPHTADSFTIAHNKILTHLKLQERNIPQPRTHVAATAEAGKKILKHIHYPIVIKLPSGTHGKGVMFADSPESGASLIDALVLLNQPFLLQEFIETDGKDIRALVIGDTVVAMKRVAARFENRANIHSGGHGETIELDATTRNLAIAAAQACGADICAVDLLLSVKGPLVLEVNISPGIQGITKTTKINVAEKMARYLFEKTSHAKGKGVLKQVSTPQEIQGKLDFRGNRILLPEVVTILSKLNSSSEVSIDVRKDKIEIKKVQRFLN